MPDNASFRNSASYHNALRRMLEEHTVTKLPIEVGTLSYSIEKFGADYIRILNKETNEIHFINPDGLKEKNLKYYIMNFGQFFQEIERVNFTAFF
jgi:hypothetical protein